MLSLRGDTKPLAVKTITVTGHTLQTYGYQSSKNERKEVVRDYLSVFYNTPRLSKFRSHLSRRQMSHSVAE